MAIETELLILGGGTGGYVAAIQAAKQGLDVVLIEQDKLGGTCLHRGCVPTKALLRSAEVMDTLNMASEFGIEVADSAKVNFSKINERKQGIVDQLHQGVQGLVKKNKIKVVHGKGAVLGPSIFSPVSGAVAVTFADEDKEEEIYVSKKLIIATGSSPATLPHLPLDEETILSSDGMLKLEKLPESIAIIGGGVIGVEWASLLHSLGVEVTIFEALDRLIVNESKTVSKALLKQFKQRGIKVELSQLVDGVEKADGKVKLSVKGNDAPMDFEKVMVAIGRKPNVEGLGLQNTSVKFDARGIHVNDHFQTTESHIYAIGDCINTLQLAHVAMKEGELAVEHIVHETSEPINYINVPRCTYTTPEIASVGYTKETLPEGMKVKMGTFYFNGNGKALIHGKSDGFVEVMKDEETDDLIGVSIIGPHATDLISEAGTAIYLNATPLELGEAIHPHPTLSEAIMEASLDVYKRAIHK